MGCRNGSKSTLVALVAGLGAVAALACSDAADAPASSPATTAKTAPAEQAEPAPSAEDLAARGRRVYLGNCTACHAMDPSQPGSLGPEVTGSSRELLEKRVLHATYPEGYEPKRTTTLMVALPHLAPDIDALTAYLNP